MTMLKNMTPRISVPSSRQFRTIQLTFRVTAAAITHELSVIKKAIALRRLVTRMQLRVLHLSVAQNSCSSAGCQNVRNLAVVRARATSTQTKKFRSHCDRNSEKTRGREGLS